MKKFRVIGVGLAVAAAGLIPCLPASAATAPAGVPSLGVEVVTPLPQNVNWHNGAFYNRTDVQLKLPTGYLYRDGGVTGPKGQVVYAPDGRHEGVVSVPVQCKGGAFEFSRVDTTNWLGNILNGAFNAARSGVEAAAGIAQAAVGASGTHGVAC
jgi:hypothetical protein